MSETCCGEPEGGTMQHRAGWCELCMDMGATHCYTFVCSISVRCFGHQVDSMKIDGASCVGAVSREVSDSKSSTTNVVEICY